MNARTSSSSPVFLGLMPPLTGLVSLYGSEITWAARIACEEINELGGVLGRPLQLIIEDDGSLPQTAVPAALRLVDEHGCAAIIGNLLSNSRIAVANHVADVKRIPYLNFSFYEGSISSRYFFHFAALPNQQIDLMIPWMARKFGIKMFFAGNNYEWPRGSIDAAKQALSKIEGDLVGEEYLPIGASHGDIDDLLNKVARSGANVFVPYFAGTDQITLLTRFSEKGLKKRMAVVMGHYDEVMVAHLAPEVRDEFYSSNSYFMSVDTSENRSYLSRLAQLPDVDGIWPNGRGALTNFGEGTYLCVKAFAKAANAAGTLEAEALVTALEQTRITGPQGEVIMDPLTHHARINSYLARCDRDGVFHIMETFGTIPPHIPDRYSVKGLELMLHESPPSPHVAARLVAEMSSAHQKAENAYRILTLADMAVLATDENGVISDCNPSACALFGYEQQELVGLSVHILLPPHQRQRHHEMIQRFVAGKETERRMSERGEVTGYRKDGTFFPLEASIAKFYTGTAWLLVVTMRDITARKQAEEELMHRASHDGLTGLPNRSLIRERLKHALHHSLRQGWNVALLFVDLDGFKLINDSHGHAAGDAVLHEVSQRLLGSVRPGDTVGRLAGDEFVVLCDQVEQPLMVSSLAQRLNEELRLPVNYGAIPLVITASIGIALGHGSTHSADDLLRSADTAMYAVKEKGKDGWQFFSEGLQDQARQKLTITHGLRFAIEKNELYTRFQPIVSAENGRIVGAELLLRWSSAEGEIPPGVFIPIAEMTGAIIPIGAWVFREACRTEADWRRRWGAEAPYVSVNLSARQLNDNALVENFTAILTESGADPQRILLEVTETSLMANIQTNLRVLNQLANLGLRVAVDDFGTGYSSLAQLTRLPVNVLKIDRAFVDGLDRQKENKAVVQAIIGLGKALDLKLVAEGVEMPSQFQELRNQHCDFIQGYLFHRPIEESRLIEIMEQAAKKSNH
ncbi:MAG: EAL domain-containing protein [Magnetococcales bacterium]|nr:EAL domain-containing protein [Magnetococcales bacterium]